jgi:signal transduction histidine kinase
LPNEMRGEWHVRRKNVEALFILADAVRITGFDDRYKKVTFVVNITARKKAEEELARKECLLREAVATKDMFFSIISHDLRNLFHSLLSGASMLMMETETLAPDTVVTLGRMINQTSQSAMDLLNNLLTWARSQTGAIQASPVKTNLLATVRMAMEPLLNISESKNVSIELLIPEEMTVFADRDMLNTILFNLIANALKFSNRGQSLTVGAREEGDFLTVSIRDTGIGMDAETLEQLFRPGNKPSNRGTDGERGTGFGLVLCREFVEKNGGEIWAESEVGRGSTFFFSLPRHGMVDNAAGTEETKGTPQDIGHS